MSRRFCISTVSAMAVGWLVLGMASQSHAQAQVWSVMSPADDSTFTTTARVSGWGGAVAPNLIATFSFSYFDDANAEVFENSTNVTSYEQSPGVFRWATIATELAADADGWKKTEFSMGHNGVIIYKYRHDANIGILNGFFNFTTRHIVQ